MSTTEFDVDKAREKEVEGVVQRQYENAIEGLFVKLDDLVGRKKMTTDEALVALSGTDDDLADNYEDWGRPE